MSFVPPPHDALYRLITYARDEAHEQELPLVEYLLSVALAELCETMHGCGEHMPAEKEKWI